jgi:hypothetical protein
MPRSSLWRAAKVLGSGGLVLVLVLVLCIGILAVRLALGPIAIPDAGSWIDSALTRSLGPGMHVTSGPAELAWTGRGLVIAVDEAVIGSLTTGDLVSAEKAEVTIDPRELLAGRLVVHGVAFVGPIVALTIGKDGRVQLNSALADALKPQGADNPPPPPDGDAAPPRHGLLAIVRELFEGNGPFAAMRDVEIRDGRLAVRDERTGEDSSFDNLNFSFLDASRGHRFALSFSGPLGPSSLSGTISRGADQGRQIHLEPAFIPLGYFLLPFLPQREAIGMSSPVGGSLDAAFDSFDRLRLVTGDLSLAALAFGGSDNGRPIVLADRLAVKFIFDPQTRVLQLRDGELTFARTQVLISGSAAATEQGWKLDLAGNANLNGEINEARIETDSVALRAHLPENLADFAIDELVILGEGANLELTGHIGTLSDGTRGAQAHASAGPMNARSLLALWPPNLAQALRSRIKDQLVRAKIERIDLTLDLSEQDIRDLAEGRGHPGGGVSVNLDLADVAFNIDPKLAMITTAAMSLNATSDDANLIIPTASLGEAGAAVPTLSHWRLTLSDLASDNPQLQTNFRLQGPAGALAGLLQRAGLAL